MSEIANNSIAAQGFNITRRMETKNSERKNEYISIEVDSKMYKKRDGKRGAGPPSKITFKIHAADTRL
jgi:hypothetical protein